MLTDQVTDMVFFLLFSVQNDNKSTASGIKRLDESFEDYFPVYSDVSDQSQDYYYDPGFTSDDR